MHQEPALLSTVDLISVQARDHLCYMFRATVRMPDSDYSKDAKGLLVRTSALERSADYSTEEHA